MASEVGDCFNCFLRTMCACCGDSTLCVNGETSLGREYGTVDMSTAGNVRAKRDMPGQCERQSYG